MNEDQILQWYDDLDDGRIKTQSFSEIPNEEKLHVSRRISGLLKLASLMRCPEKFDFSAATREVVVFNVRLRDLVGSVAEDDLSYLAQCGVYYSGEFEAFYSFC